MQAGFASFLEKISAELDTLEQDKLPVMTDADLEEILSLV